MRHLVDKRFWVFDLDGTLTEPVHDFAHICASLGVPEGTDVLRHLASLPDEHSQPLHDKLYEIELQLVTRTSAAPGARVLVELLRQRGCRLGILTRNTREIARLTLEHVGLDSYFPVEWTLGRDEALPKPHPDGIYTLAGYWHAVPADMVMVGDYLYDLQAGHTAGSATIHVHGRFERRWPEWTQLCVPSLEELAQGVQTLVD